MYETCTVIKNFPCIHSEILTFNFFLKSLIHNHSYSYVYMAVCPILHTGGHTTLSNFSQTIATAYNIILLKFKI